MKIDLSQFREAFVQESTEHVTSMESNLLKLRTAPDDLELLNAIFRSAHSIKGGAGTFGLTNLVRFTHALETLLDRLRSFEIPATETTVDVLLTSVDVLRGLLDADAGEPMPGEAKVLMDRIEAISPAAEERLPENSPALAVSPGPQRHCRVEFRPSRDLFLSGCNPLLLMRNLASLGTVTTCMVDVGRLPKLSELDPASCYLDWTVELATEASEAEIREVFEFVEHLAEVVITSNDRHELVHQPEHSQVTVAKLATEMVVSPGSMELLSPAPALMKAVGRKPAAGGESSSIRVSTDKVDRLVDLVGELVIAHVMTEQMVESFSPERLPQLRQAMVAMERSTRELHERVMAIRMLPVGTLFQRYTRVVYDIAKSTGKQIELQLAGEETEIDKSMLELLGDPLIHLIRNAADHGIESPEIRVKAGKTAQGSIRLSACHRAGRIAIELSDDGGGIDPARVRAKAVERGLISAESEASDQQLRMLIFEPGFSTRDEVSDLSGRGVGMDVVRRNIEQLNGTVFLTSEVGLGSTITIELPLTLAILEGLLVRVKNRTLVLPLLSVVETVSPGRNQIQRMAEQGETVTVRDETIPLLQLTRFLGLDSTTSSTISDRANIFSGESSRALVVIVESGGRKMGLMVDELLGQQQVVLKSLERHLHKVEGLMGATILGDGCPAPIVDVAALAKMNLFSIQPAAVHAGVLLPDRHGQLPSSGNSA